MLLHENWARPVVPDVTAEEVVVEMDVEVVVEVKEEEFAVEVLGEVVLHRGQLIRWRRFVRS